jgi:hypothetical protein
MAMILSFVSGLVLYGECGVDLGVVIAMILSFVSGLVLYGECGVDLGVVIANLTWDVDDLADLDLIGVGDLWIGDFQRFEGYAELLCDVGEGGRLDYVGGHPEDI